MSTPIRPSARLLFRIDPLPLESPRGYLCRVAQINRYYGPHCLAQLAGLRVADLERQGGAKRIAHVLRLEPEEWMAISYRHIKGPGRFQERSFYGRAVRADQFNYRRPRVCPHCLGEQPVWWAVWDLGLVAACPRHGCVLINRCPTCGKRLAWRRPAVDRCRCGTDLRKLPTEVANADLVAMSVLVYRAAGFSPGAAAERELTSYCFPPQLMRLALGPLLWLVRSIGLIGGENRLRRKQLPFPRTDLNMAIRAGQATIAIFRDWSRSFREVLRRMVPKEIENPAALTFADVFGNFYRHLFRVLPRRQFGFLHDAFETFVIEDWNGTIRGQHRYFSAAARRNSQWMSADEAEKAAHVHSKRLADLVRQGQIEGVFLKVSRGQGRTECWIRRESLNRWITARDLELAQYMPRPEAVRTLGLKNITVLRVAQAGLIRYVTGSERCFPTGFHFLREDVLKIKDAFEKHRIATVQGYSKPGELIALRHALKNYLGRDSGLPAVVRAVLDGTLAPAAYTKRFRGITGYLFRSEELRKYRPVSGLQAPPGGFVNYREAAFALGIGTEVIRGLVAKGVLRAHGEYRPGLAKLIPAADVQAFAERYVSATVLAKRLDLDGTSLRRYLNESGRLVFSIPVPDKGKALFVGTDVAGQMADPLSRGDS